MRNGGATDKCGWWLRRIGLAALVLIARAAGGSTSPPHEYYVLGPEPLSGPLSLMSLEPSNTITLGSYQVTLQQYQTAVIPVTAFTSGTKLSGTGFFTVGSAQNATDLLVPDDLAGTAFVIPHIVGSHKYFLLSPNGAAQVTIQIGASTFNVAASQGVVNEFDAGSNNSVAGRITSDVPIVVTHVAYVSGTARDAYPVAPAASDLFGIRSQNTIVGALSDGTSLTVYASNGASGTYALNAGEQVTITTGASTSQGQGSALHIVANAPVAAVQYDDGDGSDATAFWAAGNAARRHGIPVDAQYLALACDQPSVTLTLYKGTNAPETQACSGSGTTPGKAYFGSSSSGATLKAGWYVISSSAVYAMYEASTPEDEHNLLGLTPVAGPAAPTLNSVTSPTSNNPQTVSGTAGASQVVRLYVNGLLQATTTANGSGSYSFSAALIDGTNTLYTTAVTSGNESDPSNAVSVDYTNTIPRSQSGSISGTVVWTPGNPAQPYTVTAADLTVAAGAQLILQPGTQVRFGSGRRLTVNGTLVVNGTAASNVTFTSDLASPTRGSWTGLVIGSAATGVVINGATIEWAVRGVEIASGATATVRNSTIRNFSGAGLYLTGSTAATLLNANLIDNLNDQVTCIWLESASPTISGNTVRNCASGIYVRASSSPAINGNNIVTSNSNGVVVDGGFALTPQPVVTGNQLFGNSSFDYSTCCYAVGGQNVVLNATGNWWGTTDASAISGKISDLTDNYTATNLPTVNFGSFLDGPAGTAVPGNYLSGPLSAAATTLTAGATYEVISTVFVGNGKSLTIPAGTTLRFYVPAERLVIDGSLTIQGTSSSPVRLTSGRADPAAGAWQGIEVRSTATAVLIDNAVIEWTVRAVSVTSTNATIRNSVIRSFTDSGIWMSGVSSASQIANNYIDNFDGVTGTGISLTASSPAISGNQIYRAGIGIYAVGASNPAITGNAISNNGRGIQLDGLGSNSASAVPNPVITGNDIFGNTNGQIEIFRYGPSNPVVINATNNWWGTATPQSGQQIRFTSGSPSSTLNFSNPATAPATGPVSGNIVLSQYYFSPNGDSIKDATAISGTLNQSASWTVTIRNPAYSAVRTFSGSGTSIAATWDGQNSGGQIQPDGIYAIEVTAAGALGNAIVGTRVATLDNTAPATAIVSPAASAVITNVISVPVTGSANDSYLVNFTLQYGMGAVPSTWTTINSQNTTGITAGLLGNWIVSSLNGTTGLANGPYVLRLNTSDKAGNLGLIQVPVTLDLLSITAVTQNRQLMKPTLGEQLQIDFTLGGAATTYLRIYPEAGGALVKEVSQVFASGGAKSLTWDGRTATNAFAADDGYNFVIFATDGVRTATYDPPRPPGTGAGSGSVDLSFNAHKNDSWKMNYAMGHFGRVRMQVSGCGLSATHFPYNWVPFPPGTHPLIWDGRGPDGQPTAGACNIYFDPPQFMKPASVIVRGAAPLITGSGASPNIEVKSNPYRIFHSYEQFSKITYRLDQDSYVTVKLLPPGVTDPTSPLAVVLTNAELQSAQSGGQPLDHVIEWKGYEDTDTNNILVSDEGSYTFAIQATSAATGAATLYRGALQLWQ